MVNVLVYYNPNHFFHDVFMEERNLKSIYLCVLYTTSHLGDFMRNFCVFILIPNLSIYYLPFKFIQILKL